MRAIAAKEKAAKAAIAAAHESIRMYNHLLNMSKITFDDLSSHKTFFKACMRLIEKHEEDKKYYEDKIQEAINNKNRAAKELKSARNERKILETLLLLKKPIESVTAPAAMFFPKLKRSPIIEELMQDLKNYINRIKGYADKKTGKINFSHGFIFFRQSQALNRMANYKLASALLGRLKKGEPLHAVFSNIDEQRSLLIAKHGLNKRENYVERGIHSTTLNAIIRKANKHIGNEMQPLLLNGMA